MKFPRISWRFYALAALVAGAFFNDRILSANPELERKLAGCWAGTSEAEDLFPGAVVFKFDADGTFKGRGLESLTSDKKLSKAVKASGTWKVWRNKWTLTFAESNATVLFPRDGQWRLIVFDVTETSLDARGENRNGRMFSLDRVNPGSSQCVDGAWV